MVDTKTTIRDDDDEISRLKSVTELEVRQQKEKLNYGIGSRVVLKSILGEGDLCKDDSSNSDSSTSRKFRNNHSEINRKSAPLDVMLSGTSDWYNYSSVADNLYSYPLNPLYSNTRLGGPSHSFPYSHGGRMRNFKGMYSRRGRGRYRGGFRGRNSSYPAELQHQYYRYFEKFLHEHDDRTHHNLSRSRSRSYSRRSRSTSKRRYYRSRSCSRSSSKSGRRRSNSRSSSRSERSTSSRRRSRRHSRSQRSHTKRKDKSRSSSYRSIDSAKFISPSRLRMPHSRSRSRS